MLHFNNGKFKIMQIADIQENVPVNPDTVKLITLAIEKEKPDLIVLTGDQIQGYASCYLKDTLNKVRQCIYSFATPIKDSGIPFCMTFGNHDDDCKVDKNTQIEIYKEFDNFIIGTPRCEDDPGTYSLQIFDGNKEKEIFNLYFIDSNKMQKNGAYAPVKKEQIDWFRHERERLAELHGGYLPSFVFQHIPVPEFYDVLVQVPKRTKGACEAFKSRKNTFWKLDDETIAKGGFMHETPGCPEVNSGEFEALKEKGDIVGLFVGHDHINSFIANKDGIDIGYTQGAGFNTYGPGGERGIRIYVLNEENIRDYETYTVTMNELCDFRPTKPVKEFIYQNMPSSVDAGISLAKRVALPLAGAGIALALIKKLR